jgi:hypothetical protein
MNTWWPERVHGQETKKGKGKGVTNRDLQEYKGGLPQLIWWILLSHSVCLAKLISVTTRAMVLAQKIRSHCFLILIWLPSGVEVVCLKVWIFLAKDVKPVEMLVSTWQGLLILYSGSLRMSQNNHLRKWQWHCHSSVGIDNPLVPKTDTQEKESLDKAISLDQEGASKCSLLLSNTQAQNGWQWLLLISLPLTWDLSRSKVHNLPWLANRLGGWVRACSLVGNGVVQESRRRSKDPLNMQVI